ncbi:hypothetical protein [Streptomyces sp. SID12501]|uniref:Uncharacterized protein n=1 Tax=Streptomyces sp. SID12501 TaxID=2706042 RepID=A0A6B3BVJ3_9ACTN|nr:hypothetical protein [Streptomyces sp. SID12501]NEC88394.1 hypothetical protein [Streptomyces sp. SID12501]
MEGIDGSGKSTVARLVTQELEPGSTAPTGRKHTVAADPGTEASADLLRELIWSSPEKQGDTYGAAHWILLIASWYAGPARLRPDLTDAGTLAVLDGWYYRDIAKTLVREPLDTRWAESPFDPVPEPALTVLLDVAPEVARARRDNFKDTEIGCWDGFTGSSRASFFGYQTLACRELLHTAKARGRPVPTPDADDPPERTADAVATAVRALRRTP